jgi:hypothetical protein
MIAVALKDAGNAGSFPRFAETTALSGDSQRQATVKRCTLSRVIWSSGAYFVLPGSPP